MEWEYVPAKPQGDHIWWISDIGRFQSHYPGYELSLIACHLARDP